MFSHPCGAERGIVFILADCAGQVASFVRFQRAFPLIQLKPNATLFRTCPMRVRAPLFCTAIVSTILLHGCDSNRPTEPSSISEPAVVMARGVSGIATLTKLPSLGSNSEALGVNDAGTIVVGHSFDRAGMLYAVRWTLQNGSWRITTLPYTGSARAMSVSNQGVAAGYGATGPRTALRWSETATVTALDCAADAGESLANGISGGGQVAVGGSAGIPVIWRAGGCRESLPALGAGGSAATANGDGTVIGGSAASGADYLPVRWREVAGQWAIEQLDTRVGRANGSNAAGDLAGHVREPCSADANGCGRARVWYIAGGSRAIDFGGDASFASDINASGEVVGTRNSRGRSGAYLWSEALGVRELPSSGGGAVARGVSDVRGDGTRVAVGMAGTQAALWVVRNP